MEIKVKGSGNSEYIVDTENLTCTCPNFRYRCHNFSVDHPNRYCKHMHQVFEDNPELAPRALRNLEPDDVAVQYDDGKVRYPRLLFDPYVVLIDNAISVYPDLIKAHYVCGSYRRMKDMISDLDVLLVMQEDGRSPSGFFDYFESMPGFKIDKLWRGEKKASYKINELFQVDFKIIPEVSIAFSLAHFTGSKEENIRLRKIAGQKHHSLSEYGLKSDKDGQVYQYDIKTEKDLYDWLGVPYKEPWER